MQKILIFLLAIWTIGSAAWATLTTAEKSSREIALIMRSRAVTTKLPRNEKVLSVIHIPGHAYGYLVSSKSCRLFVGVHYDLESQEITITPDETTRCPQDPRH